MSWIDDLVQDRKAIRDVVAWRGELEFCGATEDDRVGRTVKLRIVRRPGDIGLAHPFAKFTRRRGNRAGTRFHASFVLIENTAMIFTGEAMMLNWSDGPSGSLIQFSIDGDGPHPFIGFTRANRTAPGTRFMCVLAEIADDETLVNQAKVERLEAAQKTKGHGQLLSNAAALICGNPRFHDFLREEVEEVDWNEGSAADWLRATLGIKSRAELDVASNKAAITGFERVRRRFVDWQEDHGGLDVLR